MTTKKTVPLSEYARGLFNFWDELEKVRNKMLKRSFFFRAYSVDEIIQITKEVSFQNEQFWTQVAKETGIPRKDFITATSETVTYQVEEETK